MRRRTFLHHAALLPAAFQVPLRDFASFFAPASLQASMWTYLWDLHDEGPENVIARLKENSMTALSIAAAYHNGKFLAPHNPKRKVIFLEDGTVYFKPTLSQYGRIKPLVNSLVTEGFDFARVKREADRMGLATNAWVVCCHNTPLGSQYPDIACEDAFGDKIVHNLCPSNPDVRSYLKAIVKDLAAQGAGRIELEALQFQGYTHGFHHEREGIALNAAMKFLLGLCFCPSCRRRAADAEFDLSAVWKFTHQTLTKHFEDQSAFAEQYRSMDDLPKDLFTPFLEWRTRVTASLAEELMEAVSGTETKLRPLASIDPTARTMVGVDPARTAPITGGLLVPGYVKDGAALRLPLAELQKLVGANELILGFQVGLPESGGKTEFLDRLSTARSMGITSYNFYNYGFIPYSHLGWIKEGLI